MLSYPFRLGDTVTFDPDSFNPSFWDGLTEEEKVRYYGPIGYKNDKTFTFICEMHPQQGHCILIEIGTGRVETMRHTCDLKLVEDDEC